MLRNLAFSNLAVKTLAAILPIAPYLLIPGPGRGEVELSVVRLVPEPAAPYVFPVLQAGSPPLSPAPGGPEPWQGGFGLHSGVMNQATGNVQLVQPIESWRTLGLGVSFALVFNSQSTASGVLGPKWRHSYEISVSGQNPAVVEYPDGKRVTYTLSGGNYVPPAGRHEKLVLNSDSTWRLTEKSGLQYRFNSNGRIMTLRDPSQNITAVSFSGGNVSAVTDAVGRSLTLGYTSGKLTTVTGPEGDVWTLSYDGSGRLYRVNEPQLGATTYFTEFGYNTNNNVTSRKNRLGHTWTYAYGSNNRFQSQTDPDGATLQASYMMEPLARRLTASLNPTIPASIARMTNEMGVTSQTRMNADGSVDSRVDALGNTTGFTYDTQFNVTAVSLPTGGNVTLAYDTTGNLTSSTDATGRTTTRTYDTNHNLLSETQPGGFTTTHTYDSARRRLTTTDPTSRTETYTYFSNGNLATSKDPANKTTTYAYDAYGNPSTVTDPLGNVTTTTYTLDRVTSRTDARNRTTGYTYDAWKRLVSVDYPSSADQSFTYDAENQMTQAVDGTGTRTFTYDAKGRKTQQTDPRGTTNATYDAASRLLSQTDVSSRLVQYTYDVAGRLTSVYDPSSSATYTYDAAGRVLTTNTSSGVRSTTTYDAAGRTTNLEHKRTADNVVLASFASTYHATTGRLSQVVEGPTAATTAYTYDNAGRLLTENRTGAAPYASSYTYETRGLRSTAFRSEGGVTSHDGTYAYDNAGRLTSVSDTVTGSGLGGSYTWHADGTLASMPGPGYTRNLEYDEEGRLTAIRRGSTLAYEYGYGFDGGRRWRKDVAGNIWDWYPCGVACCAGELITLRSTNGGSTWSTLETRLDKATVLNGNPFLGSSGSGTLQIGTEQAVTDAFGVRRSGAYGTGLNSVLNPLRGDEGVEQGTHGLSISLFQQRKDDGAVQLCHIVCEGLGCAAFGLILGELCSRIGCKLFCKQNSLRVRIDPPVLVSKACKEKATEVLCEECCTRACNRVYPGAPAAIGFCLRSCSEACRNKWE